LELPRIVVSVLLDQVERARGRVVEGQIADTEAVVRKIAVPEGLQADVWK
jgi:hypothetical protein